MNETLYQAIFKRKSFHSFRGIGEEKISVDELNSIKETYKTFKPLI